MNRIGVKCLNHVVIAIDPSVNSAKNIAGLILATKTKQGVLQVQPIVFARILWQQDTIGDLELIDYLPADNNTSDPVYKIKYIT